MTDKETFLKSLSDWLVGQPTASLSGTYCHRHLEENLDARADIIEELKMLVNKAHEDGRNRLRIIHGVENTLDPLGERATPGTEFFVIEEYPHMLPIDTLKGYFGELFAAIVAENMTPIGEDWIVPAFLFRFHDLAFDWLEQIRQGATPSPKLVGRHGDDCLAFQMDESGQIVRSLACEAKCTSSHQNNMVNEAHANISSTILVPTSYSQLIEILNTYAAENENAAAWVDALRRLRAITAGTANYERCDLVAYICGLPPTGSTTEIIPKETPHSQYTGGRRLEAVEVCLNDVEGLIEQIYGKTNSYPDISATSTDAETWEIVLPHISPLAIRNLFEQQCWLCHFDGQLAVIGVRSLEIFRQVKRRDENLKKAFKKAGLFTPTGSEKNPKIHFRHYFP